MQKYTIKIKDEKVIITKLEGEDEELEINELSKDSFFEKLLEQAKQSIFIEIDTKNSDQKFYTTLQSLQKIASIINEASKKQSNSEDPSEVKTK